MTPVVTQRVVLSTPQFHSVDGNPLILARQALSVPHFVPVGRDYTILGDQVQAETRCLVARIRGMTILFDPGPAPLPGAPNRLLENLEAIGLNPDDVDLVVLSQLHSIEAGALVTYPDGQAPRLTFPNADYMMRCFAINEAELQYDIPPEEAFLPTVPGLFSLLSTMGRERFHFVDEISGIAPSLYPYVTFRFPKAHDMGAMTPVIKTLNGELSLETASLGPRTVEIQTLDTPAHSVASVSDIGGRDTQQDASLITTGDGDISLIAVIADGHGPAGGISQRVVEEFPKILGEVYEEWKGHDFSKILRASVRRLQGKITREMMLAGEGEEARNGGCTLEALVVWKGHSYNVHVGDSRSYRLSTSGDRVEQIATDHSWHPDQDKALQEKIRMRLSGEDCLISLYSLRRALGHPLLQEGNLMSWEPDICEIVGAKKLLLCSDGLNALGEDPVQEALNLGNPRQSIADLMTAHDELTVRIRHESPEHPEIQSDNVTVIIVHAK